MGILNAFNYVTNPQIDSTNPYALQQRQQLINALKSQAVNSSQPQQTGNVIPRSSLITPLVQALSGYMAGRMQKSEDTAMQGLADKKSAASQALIQSLYGSQNQNSPQTDQAPQQAPQPSDNTVGGMLGAPNPVAPQQPMPQAAPQQMTQGQDPYAAARQKIAVISQGIQSGVIDPDLGKQLLTQAQKDATPPDDYSLGDNRFSGRTNQMIAQAPGGEDKPLDELARLTDDFKHGRISQADFNARRNLMTTRAPNMYSDIGSGGDTDAVAKMIANYQVAPPSPMRMATPQGKALLSKVLELNPDYQAQEFGSRNSAYKAFASGKQGDQVRSFNVMLSHLNTAGELADQLDNTSSPAFNKVANFFATQTGSAAPTNMDTAMQMIKAEAVKAISGAGGGVADREHALAAVNSATTPAALKGALQTVKQLAGGQLGGLKRQYETSTGRKDFEHLLSPDAMPFLNTKEGTGDSNFGNGPAQIKSDDDYAKLPSGAEFIGPDGVHRRKP